MQRAYDQLLSDLALNDSPAVILVFFAGIAGGSQTHMGVFDISLAANIPNIIYLAPTCKEEYFSMLEWGLNQKEHPVIIRVPGVETVSRDAAYCLNIVILQNMRLWSMERRWLFWHSESSLDWVKA